jgi:hypothetical protein
LFLPAATRPPIFGNGEQYMRTDICGKDEEVLYDEEAWLALLDPLLSGDPDIAESLAHLLFELRQAIHQGPQGLLLASNTLLEGLRQVYRYSDAREAAFELFETYLHGNLKPADEPVELLRAATARGRAAEAHRRAETVETDDRTDEPNEDLLSGH